jgi:hypothetical protein
MLIGRDRGGRRGRGGPLGALLVVVAVVAAVALLAGGLPSLNPFGSETVDRSQPAVLRSIEKLSDYRAATANLQVIVDVERDVRLVPSWLKGEKTLLVAAGRVDSSVDFSALDEDAVQVEDDGRRATITLPAPALAAPQLDLERTRVYDRDRGLIDRVEGVFQDSPTEDREVLLLAERKLLEAAQADPSLLEHAETNARAMLTGLLEGLGFEEVSVRFSAPPQATPRD